MLVVTLLVAAVLLLECYPVWQIWTEEGDCIRARNTGC